MSTWQPVTVNSICADATVVPEVPVTVTVCVMGVLPPLLTPPLALPPAQAVREVAAINPTAINRTPIQREGKYRRFRPTPSKASPRRPANAMRSGAPGSKGVGE